MTPLDRWLQAMQDPSASDRRRAAATRLAKPYLEAARKTALAMWASGYAFTLDLPTKTDGGKAV